MNMIFFDLEGPLSPQDNAYNLMKLFYGGDKIFEIISRYDDLLTLDMKPGYEPGDTLALIAPFLIYHGITDQDITNLANRATLVNGAKELISYLLAQKWMVYCISTSYNQYAINITQRLNIPEQNVASTNFPISRLAQQIQKADFQILDKLEDAILNNIATDDSWIKTTLDRFYWRDLQQTSFGKILSCVKPIGGQRKVEVLLHFANMNHKKLAECAVVGDSITDYKMIQAVKMAGGLAIAFNGNEFVLPYANVALASTNLNDLRQLLDYWDIHNMKKIEHWVKIKEKDFGNQPDGNFSFIKGVNDISAIVEFHKKVRRLVREDAAKLG